MKRITANAAIAARLDPYLHTGARTKAIRIDDDGTAHVVAKWKDKEIKVASRVELAPHGIILHAKVDNPLPFRPPLVSETTLTPADLVALFRWQLEHADPAIRERLIRAILDLGADALISDLTYYLERLTRTEEDEDPRSMGWVDDRGRP